MSRHETTPPTDDPMMRGVIDNNRRKRRKGWHTGGDGSGNYTKSRAAVVEFIAWLEASKATTP